MKNLKKVISMFLVVLLVVVLLPTNVNEVQAAKAKLNKTSISIQKGNSYALQLKNNTKAIKWTSSNKKIASVSSDGLVTGKKVGTTTITAKVGKKKYTCKVTVKTPDIEYFKYDELMLVKGQSTVQLFQYNNAYIFKNIKWSSSNNSIATVNNKGNITGVGDGDVTITVKYKNKSYSFKTHVVGNPILYEDNYVKVELYSMYSVPEKNLYNSLPFNYINFIVQNKTDKVITFDTDGISFDSKMVCDSNTSTSTKIPATTTTHQNIKLYQSITFNSLNNLSATMSIYDGDGYKIENIDISNFKIR